MKKIMFNDKYGLTHAVLTGMKTHTRRILNQNMQGVDVYSIKDYIIGAYAKYHVGEEVAIAQSYRDILGEEYLPTSIEDEIIRLVEANSKGISNKMFVRADLMPNRIKITSVDIQRLQDISEEDCLKEGVIKFSKSKYTVDGISVPYSLAGKGRYVQAVFRSAKEAFSVLIDKTCGKGTWEKNPWVFDYGFKLVKRWDRIG